MPDSHPELDLHELAELGVDANLIALRERLDGAAALRFLATLPSLVARWQATLGLRGARLLPGGVLSAALSCERVIDGEPVVLKLSSERASSAAAEAAALAVWGGRGACRLLWSGEDGRVMLLEAIRPGSAVVPGEDSDDAGWAAALLGLLHRGADEAPAAVPPAHSELDWRFHRARDHLAGTSHAAGFVDRAAISEAHARALELDAGAPMRRLLHGDFIDKNLLVDGAGRWVAIDPRPCTGDPCMDAAFWAVAHRPGVRVQERCQLVAAAAGLRAGRVWSWAQAFAVSEAVLVTDLERARSHASVVGLIS